MTSIHEEQTRLAQALADLTACETASVTVIQCASRKKEQELIKGLAETARKRKLVTAHISLEEHSLDSLSGMVRTLMDALVPPGDTRPKGLLWLLDLFYERRKRTALEEFDKGVKEHDAEGDLAELCRSYLTADEEDAEAEIRAFSAWCDGIEPPRRFKNAAVRRALSERTAQRNLNALTRILLGLGHKGLLLLLSEGDRMTGRTERQREKAYTVLRELIDNFDVAQGATSLRIVITGQEPLFEGPRSIRSVRPLAMRLDAPSDAAPAPPHRSATIIGANGTTRRRKIAEPTPKRAGATRNLIRISEGLPPTHKVTDMSVGQDRLDKTVQRLFELVDRSGRFFSVLTGEYGSGKTHLMMHLAERALEDERPVFWLNLERTNLDLGNPARHLSRMLEHSQMPLPKHPNALTLATRWTRSKAAVASLTKTLEEIEETDGEAALAARKALRIAEHAADPGPALERFLSAEDLAEKPGSPNYRMDAYRRVHLWVELLARREKIRGPVILIDEGENLYTSGTSLASRRTALRSLAFYGAGSIPSACVILAMTPPAFEEMKKEARDLLLDAGERESTLEVEDVEKLRKLLWGFKPQPIEPLSGPARRELAERVRAMHKSVRGSVDTPEWSAYVKRSASQLKNPRDLIRAVIDHLESEWWSRQ